MHPINHATLVMGWKNMMIYIDPVGGASPFQGMPKADLIFITHSHSDHFASTTVDAVKSTNSIIIAPQEVYNSMSTAQKNLTTILRNGSITNFLDISIEAMPAYNLTATHHAKGVGNGYILTIGGKRIYISGDTEDTPELRALKNIDVSFLSINTPYTMKVANAVSATREFRPAVVYPYHYRNSDGTYSDLNSFKKLVGMDLDIEVRLRKWY
jgi:L-ascorbate metabolism protein UlaG (beta-lactamase superfamily)